MTPPGTEPIPGWLRFGSWGALILALGTVVVPWALKRELDNNPSGAPDDPLPPANQTPDVRAYREPEPEEVSPAAVAAVWPRRWEAAFGAPISQAQLALLMAHTALATGMRPVNNNLTGVHAGRFYTGAWTVEPAAEWGGARPVNRWVTVRAYLSLDAAAADWFKVLPQDAVAALHSADPVGYARAMHGRGLIQTPLSVYVPELVAETRLYMARTSA